MKAVKIAKPTIDYTHATMELQPLVDVLARFLRNLLRCFPAWLASSCPRTARVQDVPLRNESSVPALPRIVISKAVYGYIPDWHETRDEDGLT